MFNMKEKQKYSPQIRLDSALYFFVVDFIMPGCSDALSEWDLGDEEDIMTEIRIGERKALEKCLYLGESRRRMREKDEDLRKEGQYPDGRKLILNLGPDDEQFNSRPRLMVSMYTPTDGNEVYMRITHKMNQIKNADGATAELDLVDRLKEWAREHSPNGDIVEGQDQTLSLIDPTFYESGLAEIQQNLDRRKPNGKRI